MQQTALQKRNPETREPKSFKLDTVHAGPLLQREALRLSSKAAHYTNILEKTEPKAVHSSAHKTYRNGEEVYH